MNEANYNLNRLLDEPGRILSYENIFFFDWLFGWLFKAS